MRSLLVLLAKVAVGFAAITVCVWLFFSVVRADVSSSWLSSADPTLQKIVDLPASQPPQLSSRDCVQLNYIAVDNSSGSDCFVQTQQGFIQNYGGLIMFNNTSKAVPVSSYISNSFLIPAPNQGLTVATTTAPVIGSYLHVYTDLSKDLTPKYSGFGGPLASYAINKPPDQSIRDKNGALIAFNNTGALAYSSNGSWMLADAPGRGFMRINLANLDITPFASSLNGVTDTSTRYSEIAISDDGRYAAIASDQYDYFKIYDLSTCTGTTNDTYSQLLNCQSRDYWPVMSSKLSNFHAIYSVRFTNDDNLAVAATYNWQSGASYSAETLRLTAPGKAAHGLDYLALGDSYSSGQGEFIYKDGTDTADNTCHLSPLSYPYIIGAGEFNSYESIACSGAKTKDITGAGIKNYNSDLGGAQSTGKADESFDESIYDNFLPGYRPQVEFVKRYQPSTITLSVSGNDIGFANILQDCAVPHFGWDESTCYSTYDERLQVVEAIGAAYWKLQNTYHAIQAADPGVKLYVIGYPQIVTSGNCADNVRLNSKEIMFAQQLVSYLDWSIQQAAVSVGAQYVDTQAALDGHRLCEAKSPNVAINGLTAGNDAGPFGLKIIGNESYHPNVLGHQLLAEWILQHTHNLNDPMLAAVATVRPSPSDELAQALLYNLPPSTNPPPQVATDDDTISSDVVLKNTASSVKVSGQQNGLQPNAPYQATLHAGTVMVNAGTTTSDVNGDLNFQLTPPADTSPGFYTLNIDGQNLAGQTVEVYKIIYVAASTDDYDGDGVDNTDDQCLIIPLSGQDTDSDGIDDACDPVIGDTPTYHYPVTAKLTGNTIYVINP